MTIANDIIKGRMPDFEYYLRQDDLLDDIDEYGFTPLVETAIMGRLAIAEELIKRGANVNLADVTGRTPLHWAVDNANLELSKLFLQHGADANAYTTNGFSVLVYPLLRDQTEIKQLLYQYGAKVDFALDFINGKLLGHRYELKGSADILTAQGGFIELKYEGFILEFTLAVVKDSLRRFINSYSSRHLRSHFPLIHKIMDAFAVASELLKFQQQPALLDQRKDNIEQLISSELLVLPVASRGHAFCFVRYKDLWAKIDRGENSLKEGSINFYRITRPNALTLAFFREFLYKKQPRNYFHHTINQTLGLVPLRKMPMLSQITGNCSWANVQAIVPTAYAIQQLIDFSEADLEVALNVYDIWVEWDKDRALDECINRFYLAIPARKASFATILGAILFQTCNYEVKHHLFRAEKILAILTLSEYSYILESYLNIYCVKKLTPKGNNLLKILDDCGVNPNITVMPAATRLKKREDEQ